MNRFGWAKDDLVIRHYDEEWGVPVQDDDRRFEFLILEGARAGSDGTRSSASGKRIGGPSLASARTPRPASTMPASRCRWPIPASCGTG
jgi:hypothetical protein